MKVIDQTTGRREKREGKILCLLSYLIMNIPHKCNYTSLKKNEFSKKKFFKKNKNSLKKNKNPLK